MTIIIKLETSNATGTAGLDKVTDERLKKGTGTQKIQSITNMSDKQLIDEGIRAKHVTPRDEALYHKSEEDKNELREIKKAASKSFSYKIEVK